MNVARKSFGILTKGLGELAGTLNRDKSLPINQPAPQLYPPELAIDDVAGEELLHVRKIHKQLPRRDSKAIFE
jgi:hypothetical protein